MIICAGDKKELDEAGKEMEKYKVEVLSVVADLSREEDIDQLVHLVEDKFGGSTFWSIMQELLVNPCLLWS